jgi:hypothetical protein
MPQKNEHVSAIVLLRPASGERIGGASQITAETLPRYLPAKDSAERARAYFLQRGFDVSALSGISFNITGGVERFEQEFGVEIDLTEGYPRVTLDAGTFAYELPLGRLPVSLRDVIEAVTFEEPAEMFGGTFE